MYLDQRGNACPLPVIAAKDALASMAAGETLEVLVDNEITVQNLQKLAVQKGLAFEYTERTDGNFLASIAAGAAIADGAPQKEGKLVIAIGSDQMGQGSAELGKILMKGFLFAVAKGEDKPADVIMFNSGAYLACDGSESVEDLKTLEKSGVNITVCGTCLDFYKLKDSLKVGSVTNMYEIAAKMGAAARLIRL